MSEPVKYRAFISYSHRDKQWGEWLHQKLERYRVPSKIVGRETDVGPIPDRLTPIFRDRDELATSHDLGAEIQTALENSMFLLVICSPASAQSKWVNEEIKTFKRLHGETRVRAVIVDGEPYSDDSKTECFPQALKYLVGEDGEITGTRAEPIAADLRKGGDGKKYAISKLVAGLTGARLDDLIQREQARRNARMRLVAGGMSAVSVAFAGIAWEAVKQRDAARVAQAEAEQARDDAEGLVEFMLTDLRTELNAVGRLDILEMPGKRALAYYNARDLATADPDSLGRRARAQLLVGEVDNLRGDLDAALEAYTAAAKTTEEQLRRDPDNPDRIFDHSQSVFWVGYIAWQRGDAETARTYWTQYYDQAKRLVEIDPNNDDYQAELEYSYSNLGTLEMDQGNAAVAEDWFRKSLGVSKALADKYPDDVNRQIAAGQSYSWLAEALYHQAKIREAREAREAEITIYENAKTKSNDDALLDNNESIARYSYADILLSEGRIDVAVVEAEKATELADRLFSADPSNLHLADRAILARSILGEALLHSKDHDLAAETLLFALAIAEKLIEEDPSNLRWLGKVTLWPTFLSARLEEEKKNTAAALSAFKKLKMDLDKLSAELSAERTAEHIHLASSAGVARTSTNASEWQTIVTSIENDVERLGPKTKIVLIEAHANLDQHNQASSLASALYASGYRHPEFIRIIDNHPFLNPDTE